MNQLPRSFELIHNILSRYKKYKYDYLRLYALIPSLAASVNLQNYFQNIKAAMAPILDMDHFLKLFTVIVYNIFSIIIHYPFPLLYKPLYTLNCLVSWITGGPVDH